MNQLTELLNSIKETPNTTVFGELNWITQKNNKFYTGSNQNDFYDNKDMRECRSVREGAEKALKKLDRLAVKAKNIIKIINDAEVKNNGLIF